MAVTETMISAFTTLLVTVDPPGLAPLFLGLTQGMTRAQRQQVAVRGSVIGFAILAAFALFGAALLGTLGIYTSALRIAGGLLLFTIAFEMIFEKRNERKEKTTGDAITKDHIHNLAAFPLAIPLIAGPGALSATVLISGAMSDWVDKLMLIGVIGVVLLLVFVCLSLADRLNRFLGVTGRAVLTRLLGVLLAALSVQFVVDGVKSAFGI
jgi:multiple antibiotic resistance protein